MEHAQVTSPSPALVEMCMLMRMIGPVLVDMGMHGSGRRQLVRQMSANPLDMMGVIVTSPHVLRSVIGYQQAFAMMPALAKDIIILLAPGRPLLFA